MTLQYCGNELTRVGLHDAAISIHMSPYNGTVVMSGMRHNSGACLLETGVKQTKLDRGKTVRPCTLWRSRTPISLTLTPWGITITQLCLTTPTRRPPKIGYGCGSCCTRPQSKSQSGFEGACGVIWRNLTSRPRWQCRENAVMGDVCLVTPFHEGRANGDVVEGR